MNKKILVTNDDGVRSEGIHVLAAALRRLGDVIVVAPHIEASAIGHALTLRRPLRMEQINDGVYEVDGTPTDCVNIAVTQLYSGLPDLVVSGINKGYNLGDDVTYSGTVAGAMEGALLGIPSIAVSLERTRGPYDFEHAGGRRGLGGGGSARAGSAVARVPEPQRAARSAEGAARHRPGQAQPRDGRGGARGSRGIGRTTGSKKGRTTGSRTTSRTTRRSRTATCR